MIESLRQEINRLDDIIIEAVEKRQRVVQDIQRAKEDRDVNPRDEDREQEILDKIDDKADVSAEELKSAYRELFQAAPNKTEP